MNIQKLMRQAQQMQEKVQRELGELSVEASVGGGGLSTVGGSTVEASTAAGSTAGASTTSRSSRTLLSAATHRIASSSSPPTTR